MGTEMADSVQPVSLEPGPYRALIDALQPLLATEATLTLLTLTGEAPVGVTGPTCSTMKTCMDDVEQLLLACFRRSDRIVRCGEGSCAAVLLGAGVEGALCAVQRFQRMLGSWKGLAVSLRIGLAAAPEQAAESRALLALALEPRLHILPAAGAEQGMLPRMDELARHEASLLRPLPKGRAVRRRASKASARLEQMLAVPEAAEPLPESRWVLRGEEPAERPNALTRARARALGIPYIAPPHRIPSSVRDLLSLEVMRQLQCLPIGRDRNALTVALADPTNRGTLHRLEQLTGLTIFPVMTDPDALETLAQPASARRTSQVAPAPASVCSD